MGAPATLSELMLSVPSSDIKILPIEYVQSHLQSPAEVDEWMIAKCGDIDTSVKHLKQSIPSKLPAIRKEIDESFRCRREALRTVRAATFDAAMTSAIAKANPANFSSGLQQFITHRPKNFRTLVGQKITDVNDELRWLGLGAGTRYSVDDLVMDGPNNGAIHAYLGRDGTISSLELMLRGSPDGYPPKYVGPIFNGLPDGPTTLDWLNNNLGRPIGKLASIGNSIIYVYESDGNTSAAFIDPHTSEVISLRLCGSGNSCSVFVDAVKAKKN